MQQLLHKSFELFLLQFATQAKIFVQIENEMKKYTILFQIPFIYSFETQAISNRDQLVNFQYLSVSCHITNL